ncbi:ornithine carbamoyltransferase [[Clostridium] fimetarium]|uniref:Ornithine carbamoyltransferase n=1 Tax=[Clostridium] fimetarium TaxID=99656 RepID=A0A1I0PEI1_9FIRM|nr:peptide transporter [[Clostridium] fimetarium]SEW12630.1 ornithine carbamoyltransferase [[Clostridium] fimetarium]
MRNLIRLRDYTKNDVQEIFHIAEELQAGKYKDFLKGKTIVMFFPESSIRTRVTFEKGIYLLGGQTILFSPATLDKKEKVEDVIGYLNNWADGLIVRHKNISVLDEMSIYADFPIINAMTDINHPCEMLSDLYALSKIRPDFTKDRFLFAGASGNIGLAWKEASELMGFSLTQSCPIAYKMQDVDYIGNLKEAIVGKDIVCTDSFSSDKVKDFSEYQITLKLMKSANSNAILNPCPPFYRGEEVSADAIDSAYYVGYSFKKHLLEIQQAIIIFSLIN